MPRHLGHVSPYRRRCTLSPRTCLTGNIDIGHDHDNGVLLHVEWSVVQSERLSEEAKFAFRHGVVPSNTQGICDQLDSQGSDSDGRLAQSEERVETGGDGS